MEILSFFFHVCKFFSSLFFIFLCSSFVLFLSFSPAFFLTPLHQNQPAYHHSLPLRLCFYPPIVFLSLLHSQCSQVARNQISGFSISFLLIPTEYPLPRTHTHTHTHTQIYSSFNVYTKFNLRPQTVQISAATLCQICEDKALSSQCHWLIPNTDGKNVTSKDATKF